MRPTVVGGDYVEVVDEGDVTVGLHVLLWINDFHDVAGVVARRQLVSSCLGQHMVEYTAYFGSIRRARTRIRVRFVGNRRVAQQLTQLIDELCAVGVKPA